MKDINTTSANRIQSTVYTFALCIKQLNVEPNYSKVMMNNLAQKDNTFALINLYLSCLRRTNNTRQQPKVKRKF
jgi:hypothetical protein